MSLAKAENESGAHRPAWFAIWPVARTALHLVFRRKLFWVLFAVALFSFLFRFGAIYFLALLPELRELPPFLVKIITPLLKDLNGSGT